MSRSKNRPSLLKRLITMILLVSGGGAGVGGLVFKDHPTVQALLAFFSGTTTDEDAAEGEKTLVSDVASILKPAADFRKAGVYQVTIKKVEIDPLLFKSKQTVNIQARVLKRDPRGRDAVLWDSRNYGDRLATVGKDDLSVGWSDRPFQVAWSPGDKVLLEVCDRRTGLFAETQRFNLVSGAPAPAEFPLKTGDFPLEPAEKPDRRIDPRINHVVLKSERLDDSKPHPQGPSQVAERPIVIK